jgi:hypothetical protein
VVVHSIPASPTGEENKVSPNFKIFFLVSRQRGQLVQQQNRLTNANEVVA